MSDNLPVLLVISGLDPSNHAGYGADIRVASRLGVHPVGAVTAATIQVPGNYLGAVCVPPDTLAKQLTELVAFYNIKAVKVGMVLSLDTCKALTGILKEINCPIVMDPLRQASAGPWLLADNAREYYVNEMLPLATLLTPNLPEARFLADSEQTSQEELCQTLHEKFHVPVLVKGGHGEEDALQDMLFDGEHMDTWIRKRVEGIDTHGSGCILSSAIASYLARGYELQDAVDEAEMFFGNCLDNKDPLDGKSYLGLSQS